MAAERKNLGVALFEKVKMPLNGLPILVRDPKVGIGEHGQVMRVYPEELDKPVMLWRDGDNRCVMLCLRGHGDFKITTMKKSPPVKNLRGTLKLFIDKSNWQFTHHLFGVMTDEKEQGYLYRAINEHHEKNGHVGSSIDVCDTCEVINDFYSVEWLEQLLFGNNPLFKVQV